jgi:hypothetical protein
LYAGSFFSRYTASATGKREKGREKGRGRDGKREGDGERKRSVEEKELCSTVRKGRQIDRVQTRYVYVLCSNIREKRRSARREEKINLSLFFL